MSWFVYAEPGAARQLEKGQPPPTLVVEPGLHRRPLAFQVGEGRFQVGTHQIKLVSRLSRLIGMHCNLRRWEAKDRPPAARVHRVKPEYVLEEDPIGVGVIAVDDRVSPVDHSDTPCSLSQPGQAVDGAVDLNAQVPPISAVSGRAGSTLTIARAPCSASAQTGSSRGANVVAS